MNTICAFDLDNTLYDLIDYYGPAFRGMISALSKITGLTKQELEESARKVYLARGFLEYPFVIREMHVFSELDGAQLYQLELLGQTVFNKVKKSRLKLYPDVEHVLRSLRQGGVKMIAVSNAPLYHAYKRVKQLHLSEFLDMIVACENLAIPPGVSIRANPEPWLSDASLLAISFPRAKGKPNIHPFALVQETFGTECQYWSIGDNVERDLKPAKRLGFQTIWARYGTKVDEKNYRTVLDLTCDDVLKHEIATSDYVPDFSIDKFADILEIVPYAKQLQLF